MKYWHTVVFKNGSEIDFKTSYKLDFVTLDKEGYIRILANSNKWKDKTNTINLSTSDVLYTISGEVVE